MHPHRRNRHHRIPCLVAVVAALLLLAGCGGDDSSTPPPLAASITSFAAAQDPVTTGTAATLTAVFSDGTGSIDQGIGAVQSGVAMSSGPLSADRTFTLTVTGVGSSPTRRLTVHTVAPPVINGFVATPAAILAGQAATLTWTTTGAATLAIDHGVGTVNGTSVIVTPGTATTYTLTASNAAGASVTAAARVSVSSGPDVAHFAAPPAPRSVKTGTKFGITYQVPGFDWLGPHYQYPFVRRGVDRDFAMMESLAVETMKFTYNANSAFVFTPDHGGKLRTGVIDAAYPYVDSCLSSLGENLQRAVDGGIQPILCFMTNELYTMGPSGLYTSGGPAWSEYAYKNGPGYTQMARDLATWEQGIVQAARQTPAWDAIYYINLSTEMAAPNLGADYTAIFDPQVALLPQNVPVPAAKLAMDAFAGVLNPYTGHFLYDEVDTRLATQALAHGTPLAITEWHDYPDGFGNAYPGYPAWVPGIASPALVQQTTEEAVALATQLFAAVNPPGVTTDLVIGESGASYTYYETQEAQADCFEALWRGAQGAKAMNYGWGFWDDHPLIDPYGTDPGRLGFGFSPDEPRDILGRAVELRSDLPGGDFETGTAGWTAGSSAGGGAALSWFGGSRGDAATGLHCIRLTITKPGLAWVCSPSFGVAGQHAALSAYVRTNAAGYSANLYTYQSGTGWNPVPQLHPVATDAASLEAALAAYRWETPPVLPAYFDPGNTWHFFQLQNLTPGSVFDLPAGTTGAVACFWTVAPDGTSAASPVILDLDTVSIHGFSPLSATAQSVAVARQAPIPTGISTRSPRAASNPRRPGTADRRAPNVH